MEPTLDTAFGVAEKAAVILPVSRSGYEHFDRRLWEIYARDEFDKLGVCMPETIELQVIERQSIDGIVIPMTFEGYTLPDDTVLLRFTAYVVPNEERLADLESERLEDWEEDGGK
jgi:hypothetical protein